MKKIKPLIVIHDKDEHHVVYIEYKKGLPFSVQTIEWIATAKKPYWRLTWWDFFPNNGDRNDLRAYEAGSGGDHKSIPAPRWINGYTGEYWIRSDIRLKGKPKNAKQLTEPKRIYGWCNKSSINPFKIAEITYSRDHCEECGHESADICWDHKYEDGEGNLRYIDNNAMAE